MPKKTTSRKRGPGRPPSGGRKPQHQLRVADVQWERWREAATAEGISLNEWIRRVCEAAAGTGR